MRSNAVGGGGDCTLSLAWDGAVMMPLQSKPFPLAYIVLLHSHHNFLHVLQHISWRKRICTQPDNDNLETFLWRQSFAFVSTMDEEL